MANLSLLIDCINIRRMQQNYPYYPSFAEIFDSLMPIFYLVLKNAVIEAV